MNSNNYRKTVNAVLSFNGKILLSKVLKESYHKGFWTNPGGKINKDESLVDAVQREILEETALWLPRVAFQLIDCYIYDERKLKAFVFHVNVPQWGLMFKDVKDTEPTKHSPWQLFTPQEALELNLMPSVRYFILNK